MALDLADFDPLGSLPAQAHASSVSDAPDSPFSAALRGTSQPAGVSSAGARANDTDLLIDFAWSPPKLASTPSLVLPVRDDGYSASTASPPPAISGRQTTLLDDSFDGVDPTSVANTPFASLSPPPTVRRVAPPPANEDRPATTRTVGRRWSVMSRLQAEKRRASGHGLSPVKDCSPVKEGDSSMFLSPQHLGAADMSLIADEGGSFLLHEADETTLDKSTMSDICEESEEASEGMSTLLRGLGQSTIGSARFPSSRSTPALSTIFSASQSPPLLSRSPGAPQPPASVIEPSFALDDPSPADATFLNSSTASFKEYRDSPVKPRVVSIQAEHWIAEEDELEDDGKTPRPPVRKFGRNSGASDTSSGTEEGPSSSSFEFTRWQTGEIGTGILNQSPPTAALLAESTRTVELVQSAAPPVPDSPTSTLASSTRTVVAADSSAPAMTPARASTNETGAERLKRRMDELRAQKKGVAGAGVPVQPVKTSVAAATPARRLSLRPPVTEAPRPAQPSRPRLSTLPSATSARSRLVATSGAATDPPKTPGERKETTAARLDRLRSERKERQEARAKSPEKPAQGLKRTSSLVAPAKASFGSAPLARKSVADLRTARVAAPSTSAAVEPPPRRLSTLPAPSRPIGRPSLAPAPSRPSLAPSRPSLAPCRPSPAPSRPSLAPSTSKTSFASLASSTSSTASNVTVTARTSPRKSAVARPSLQPGTTGLKRPSLAKPTFSTVPLPRARQPLAQTQPGVGASVPPLKPRVSRIGLGRPG